MTPQAIDIPPVPAARALRPACLFWLVLARAARLELLSGGNVSGAAAGHRCRQHGEIRLRLPQPNFKDWRYLSSARLLVTVQIAVWGTFLAVDRSACRFALLCSNNVAPVWVVQPVRRLMDACRSINELVFAVLFVVAVGLGPFAGVMAIFINTSGIICQAVFGSRRSLRSAPG